MTIPAIIVTHDGADITDKTISYERRQDICSGIGTLDLIIEYATGVNIQAWDRIRLREGGRLKGTYYVTSTEKDARSGGMSVSCQDGSKKLSEYFIADIYNINYATYARYWIEKFLTDAGVTYSFTTESNGALLSENFSLGPASAYDTIQSLLQNSAWYMYFDNDNTCIIGELDVDLSSVDKTVRNHQILKLNTTKDDKMLRNRVVVWGNQDSETDDWVWADLTQHTPWDRSNNDIRTTVIANSMIRNSATAYSLASKVLTELARITYVKEVTLIGEHNIQLGDVVRVKSKYYSGEGLVTTIASQGSSSGLLTIATLDQRCPRIFGYVSYLDYVYIGTNGGGVWRKPLDSNEWEAFSTGLDHWNVTDLIIKNGIFACVADGYCYTNVDRTADWQIYYPIGLTDLSGFAYSATAYEAVAVDIDSYTNNILIGYRLKEPGMSGEYRSWVVEITPEEHEEISRREIFLTDETMQDFKLIDVEKYGSKRLATAEAPAAYAFLDGDIWGTRKVYKFIDPDPRTNTYGPLPTEIQIDDMVESVSYDAGNYYRDSSIITEGNSITELISWDTRTFKYYNFLPEYEFGSGDFTKITWELTWPYSYVVPGAGDSILAQILWRKSATGSDDDRLYHTMDFYDNASTHGIRHVSITPLLEGVPYQVGSVRCATTTNITLFDEQIIDGILVQGGDRVLVKDQTDATRNGIYIASKTNWYRSPDAYISSQVQYGLFVGVLYGTSNSRTAWQISTEDTIELGISEIEFTQVLKITSEFSTVYSSAEFRENDMGLYGLSEFSNPPRNRNGKVYYFYYGNYNESVYPPPTNPFYTVGQQNYYVVTYDFQARAYTKTLLNTINFTSQIDDSIKTNLNYETYGVTGLIPYGTDDQAYGIVRILFQRYPWTSANVKFEILSLNGEVTSTELWRVPWLEDDPDPLCPEQVVDMIKFNGGQCVWSGSFINGNNITSYVKFRFKAYYRIMCTGCLLRGDRDIMEEIESQIYGVVSMPDMAITSLEERQRGKLLDIELCKNTDFDNWDYNELLMDYAGINPLYTKTGTPIFTYGSAIYDATAANSQLGTIPCGDLIAKQRDDLTGAIFVWCQVYKKIYLLDQGGGVMATINVGGVIYPWNNNIFSRLIYTNGFFIFLHYSGSQKIDGIFIIRLNPECLFDGMKFCYLLEEEIPEDEEDTYADYKVLDIDFFDLKTECSQEYPLVAWTQPPSLVIWTYNGVTYSGGGEHLKWYDTEFLDATISGEFNDLRIMDTHNTFSLASGSIDTDYANFILATDRETNLIILSAESYEQENLQIAYTFPSSMGKIETSNYSYPYLFVSTSGIGFYQRDPFDTIFDNYFPPVTVSGEINVIRIDDRV